MFHLQIIGEGATTKIYRDGNTAMKLYINAPPDEAQNEAKNQRFAFDAGLPVPAVMDVRKKVEKACQIKPIDSLGKSSTQNI